MIVARGERDDVSEMGESVGGKRGWARGWCEAEKNRGDGGACTGEPVMAGWGSRGRRAGMVERA